MKKAFSMIELILAIVIIGVSILAIPTIITQNTQSSAYALQQEAISEAKTVMGVILAKPWDSAIKDVNTYEPILLTDSTDKDLNNRVGLVSASVSTSSRPVIDRNFHASSSFVSKLIPESIDEYSNYELEVNPSIRNTSQRKENGDILFKLRGKVWIDYLPDALISGKYSTDNNIRFIFSNAKAPKTSNIKHIIVSVKLGDRYPIDQNDADINLHAYACNIGESGFISKTIPPPTP